MENEKYLPESSNQIKLVGFDKEKSVYNKEQKYFTEVVFITTGDNEVTKQRFKEKIVNFDKFSELIISRATLGSISGDVGKTSEIEIGRAIGGAIGGIWGALGETSGVHTSSTQSILFNSNTLIFKNVKIKLANLQQLIDIVKNCLAEIEKAEFDKQQKIIQEQSEFENQINNLKF